MDGRRSVPRRRGLVLLAGAIAILGAGAVHAGAALQSPGPAVVELKLEGVVDPFVASYVSDAGLSWEEFLRLGQDGPPNPLQPFSMAVLALRLCGHANAVSQLHAKVSRRLWLGLLPELAVGAKVADVIAILGSLDTVLGEVDR